MKENAENFTGGNNYLHSYEGSHRFADYNTCGQAAIATVLDYWGLNPYGLEKPVYDGRDGRYHWRDSEVIDRIKERFPPDHLFGLFGTTGGRIAEALNEAGLTTRLAYSADLEVGSRIWEDVKRSLDRGTPVIVIVDRGKLGGRPFAAHWAVAYKVAGSKVHMANSKGTPVVPEARFLDAFRCRFMPARFNHCAVFGQPE